VNDGLALHDFRCWHARLCRAPCADDGLMPRRVEWGGRGGCLICLRRVGPSSRRLFAAPSAEGESASIRRLRNLVVRWLRNGRPLHRA
jgi:hypothetical protein